MSFAPDLIAVTYAVSTHRVSANVAVAFHGILGGPSRLVGVRDRVTSTGNPPKRTKTKSYT